jgi:hypothetical protein
VNRNIGSRILSLILKRCDGRGRQPAARRLVLRPVRDLALARAVADAVVARARRAQVATFSGRLRTGGDILGALAHRWRHSRGACAQVATLHFLHSFSSFAQIKVPEAALGCTSSVFSFWEYGKDELPAVALEHIQFECSRTIPGGLEARQNVAH